MMQIIITGRFIIRVSRICNKRNTLRLKIFRYFNTCIYNITFCILIFVFVVYYVVPLVEKPSKTTKPHIPSFKETE